MKDEAVAACFIVWFYICVLCKDEIIFCQEISSVSVNAVNDLIQNFTLCV